MRFRSMRVFLFVLGLIVQLERLVAMVPQEAMAIFLRRILWLFVFGMVDVLVFW